MTAATEDWISAALQNSLRPASADRLLEIRICWFLEIDVYWTHFNSLGGSQVRQNDNMVGAWSMLLSNQPRHFSPTCAIMPFSFGARNSSAKRQNAGHLGPIMPHPKCGPKISSHLKSSLMVVPTWYLGVPWRRPLPSPPGVGWPDAPRSRSP